MASKILSGIAMADKTATTPLLSDFTLGPVALLEILINYWNWREAWREGLIQDEPTKEEKGEGQS